MGPVVSANEIEFGGSTTYQLFAGDNLALRAGYGQPRLYDLEPTEADCTVSLPDARRLRPGFRHFVLLNKSSVESFDVYAQDGTTKITTINANAMAVLHLASNSTANGTWIVQGAASYGRGANLGTNRFPVTLIFNETVASPYIPQLAQEKGWDGVSPVALIVTVNASGIIRSISPTREALTLFGFPANSSFLLVNFGKIIGAGGRGGAGGPLSGSPSTPRTGGEPGAHAILIDQNLTIANFGVIGGGGGGGVGTAAGSGGGGAGLQPGLGGTVYTTASGYAGANGTETAGGAGAGTGVTASGAGGNLGEAGASNLSAETMIFGGAKGYAIYRIGTPTVTTIIAGTQYGGVS